MTRSTIVSALLVTVCSFGISSCIIHADPLLPPPVGVVVGPPVEYGYQPILYDGYVVYYTNDGVPFYWMSGHRVWVPVRVRTRYVTHWRTHRHAYGVWHSKRGHSYRAHRYHKKHHAVKAKKAKYHHTKKHKKSRKTKKPRHRHHRHRR